MSRTAHEFAFICSHRRSKSVRTSIEFPFSPHTAVELTVSSQLNDTFCSIALNSLLGEDGYFVVSELQVVVSPEPIGTTRIGMRTGHCHTSTAR